MRDPLLLVAAVTVGLLVVWAGRRLARAVTRAGEDRKIATMIAQRGVNRLTGTRRHYDGFDPALRGETALKRQSADKARALANGMDATHTRPPVEEARPLPFRKGSRS